MPDNQLGMDTKHFHDNPNDTNGSSKPSPTQSPSQKTAAGASSTTSSQPSTIQDLRVNLQNANVLTKLECLLENELFTDFTFLVGEHKEPVRCHTLFLKMQSKHFEDILSQEKHTMEITPCSVPVFRKMLKYLYTDKLEVSAAEAMDALILAKRFHLSTLQRKCGKIVLEGIDMDNSASILRKADELGDKELSMKAQEFIIQHANQVMKTDGFKEMSISALQKLLQHNRKLWNSSEAQILEGVTVWAAAECLRQEKSVTGLNQYSVAKSALKHINFKKFSPMEFTTYVVKQKLLPDLEMLEIQSELIEKEVSGRTDAASRFHQTATPSTSLPQNPTSSPQEDDQLSDISEIETPSSANADDDTASVAGLVEEANYSSFYTLARYTCPINEDWKPNSLDGKYKISFSCSQPVNIVGVSLYGYASTTKLTDVTFKIASFDEQTTYADFTQKSVLPKDGGEFDVMFENPVHIKRVDWYTINCCVNSRVFPFGTGGRKNYAVEAGTTKVEFNFKNSEGVKGASHVRGQLPKIYFTVAN